MTLSRFSVNLVRMAPAEPDATLTDEERIARIRLARTENVGPISFLRLIERHGSAAAAIGALPEIASRTGRSLAVPPQEAAQREIQAHSRAGARLVVWGDADYPPMLAAITDPPPLLSVLGAVEMLSRPSIAIVGARNASAGGQRLAETIARDLSERGIMVVSGLARGIDAAAHRAALANGTVAVVAGGVDIIYPPEHAELHRHIAAGGAVVAKRPLGSEPQARHFPRRNRVIAGLVAGVVVIEAAQRSGSLITARVALDEGREVFAVPGSPLDPRCRGSNDLLRHGAVLTESADDILEALGSRLAEPRIPPRQQLGAPPLPPSRLPIAPFPQAAPSAADPQAAILESLGPTPVAVDELVRRCQLSPSIVSTVLLELELAGRLERHPGQRVSLL